MALPAAEWIALHQLELVWMFHVEHRHRTRFQAWRSSHPLAADTATDRFDHSRRLLNHTNTTLVQPQHRRTGPTHCGLVTGEFDGGRRTLDSENAPPGPSQGKTPSHQPSQGRHGPRRHDVRARPVTKHRCVFGSTTDHLNWQIKRLNHLAQEGRPPQQRLDQRDLQVWPGDREHNAWQARSTSDVQDHAVLTQELTDHCTVQQMTRPQPFAFSRTDQASHRRHGRQRIGVPPR